MKFTPFFYLASIAAGLAAYVQPAPAEVFFGWGQPTGGGYVGNYREFSSQGQFFASSDYGFTPGGEDQLSAVKLGFKWTRDCPYIRGQNPVSVSQLGKGFYGTSWLSDGSDTIFGLSFDEPFKPRWSEKPEQQFAVFPDQTPRFETAKIYWGRQVPKPDTWGACILDAEGKLKRVAVSHEPLFPFDVSTIRFPATTVKKLYFGVRGGEKSDNYAEVRRIYLQMQNEPVLTNRILVNQPDCYSAYYSATNPGEIEKLLVSNFLMSRGIFRDAPLVSNLAPFVEVDGKRLDVIQDKASVKTSQEGSVNTLAYPLEYKLPDGKTARLNVTATFGIDPKAAIKLAFAGSGLPKSARIGFGMKGDTRLFKDFVNLSGTMALTGAKILNTPAGPLGISWKGDGQLLIGRAKEGVQMEIASSTPSLEVTLGLPIGADAGIQPGMVTYATRPSLAGQGDPGIAPFKDDDLEFMETINVGDPNDPYTVYDITNDPLIAKWRASGEAKLPRKFGSLDAINEPEKAKVPITKVLGTQCRDIGSYPNTYFRVNLKTQFESQVPYLIVVEHAFDKERRGEFHAIAVNRDGTAWNEDHSLWHNAAPYGGFDTGKGPYSGGFKKESILTFRPILMNCMPTTMLSFVFSNSRWSQYFKNFEKNPDGLAIKSITVYRVKRLPVLPDLQPLLPKGPQRHVTIDTEYFTPWHLTEFSKIYGYDGLWTHNQPAAQLLYGSSYTGERPTWGNWVQPNTLQANRTLYEKAAREGLNVKTSLGWLLDLGFEGTGHGSFLGFGWLGGPLWGSMPLDPTPQEYEHIGAALDRSLSAIGQYSSLKDIAVSDVTICSKRNMEDFSRATGVAFEASPAWEENLKRLLESPQPTVEAWTKWSCQKRFEFLSWVLKKARAYRPDIRLTINQTWYHNGLQTMFYGDQWLFNTAGLAPAGLKTYADFIKFMGIDPALYAKDAGFAFGVDMEPPCLLPGKGYWPYEGSAKELVDGFGGGLSVSLNFWDESPKALQGWGCNFMKDQRGFRKGIIDAVLQANAREYVMQSYYEGNRGRVADLRELGVPFRLLPFAKPEPYTGKLDDPTQQAVIQKYADRYGLANAGDKPTDVKLTLPTGAKMLLDLSGGVRQELAPNADGTVTIHLEPWSLKTLEIK